MKRSYDIMFGDMQLILLARAHTGRWQSKRGRPSVSLMESQRDVPPTRTCVVHW